MGDWYFPLCFEYLCGVVYRYVWIGICTWTCISKLEGNYDDPKGIVLSKKLFETDKTFKFKVGAFGVILITVLLYALFWKMDRDKLH